MLPTGPGGLLLGGSLSPCAWLLWVGRGPGQKGLPDGAEPRFPILTTQDTLTGASRSHDSVDSVATACPCSVPVALEVGELSWGDPVTRAHSLVASVLGLCLPRWPLRLSSTGSSLEVMLSGVGGSSCDSVNFPPLISLNHISPSWYLSGRAGLRASLPTPWDLAVRG